MCLLYITMRSNFHKTRNWSANKNSPGICKDDTDLIRPRPHHYEANSGAECFGESLSRGGKMWQAADDPDVLV